MITTVNTTKKDFMAVLLQLKAGLPIRRSAAKEIVCEVTVTDGKVVAAITGSIFELACVTEGTCKFTLRLLHLFDLIKSIKSGEIKLEITYGWLKVAQFKAAVKTTFFADDSILRTLDLPINYSPMDVLKIDGGNYYTPEELSFNNFDEVIENTKRELNSDLKKAFKLLQKYHIDYTDLEKLVETKIASAGDEH